MRELLPAFGGPTMAMLKPSLMRSPRLRLVKSPTQTHAEKVRGERHFPDLASFKCARILFRNSLTRRETFQSQSYSWMPAVSSLSLSTPDPALCWQSSLLVQCSCACACICDCTCLRHFFFEPLVLSKVYYCFQVREAFYEVRAPAFVQSTELALSRCWICIT